MSTPAMQSAAKQPARPPRGKVDFETSLRGARLEIAIFDALGDGLDSANAIAQHVGATESATQTALRRMHLDGLVYRRRGRVAAYTLEDEQGEAQCSTCP